MKLTNDIRVMRINNVSLYHNLGDSPRYVFDADAISGWDDGADIRRSDGPRPYGSGDFREPGNSGSKVITLTGTAVANSPHELHRMRDDFVSMLSPERYDYISLSNGSDTRYTLASLGGAPSWLQRNDTVASWKIDIYAPDPRMYSEEYETQIVSDGTAGVGFDFPVDYPVDFGVRTQRQNIILSNDGNAPAWPVFKITGDYPEGFKIRNSDGNEIVYSGSVTHSAPIVIDTMTGSATVHGVDRSYLLTKRGWFSIPPYSSITPQFIPVRESDGWMDVTWRHTWL